MPFIKHAVICAAGMGTRLGMNLPKCLVKVGNRKIIDYQLELLKDIEDVRIVVGFMEEEVINHVLKIRKDVTFVRNPIYHNTTNAYSLSLGVKYLDESYLMLDGDLLINQEEFESFINSIEKDKLLIGVTPSKTEEAVFVQLNENGECEAFTREEVTDFEWSGVAYIPNNAEISKKGKYVYQELEKHLPCKVHKINCYEIDTPKDLSIAHAYFTEK